MVVMAFSWSWVYGLVVWLQGVLGESCKWLFLSEKLSEESVRILIGSSFPGRVRMSKVESHSCLISCNLVVGKLSSVHPFCAMRIFSELIQLMERRFPFTSLCHSHASLWTGSEWSEGSTLFELYSSCSRIPYVSVTHELRCATRGSHTPEYEHPTKSVRHMRGIGDPCYEQILTGWQKRGVYWMIWLV